jgi:hypothetical protein
VVGRDDEVVGRRGGGGGSRISWWIEGEGLSWGLRRLLSELEGLWWYILLEYLRDTVS